ncbi:MAG TPA: hypothetical protein QF564_20395 [Pirellulaceae bacterium]|jgi:hypothetical protein|nr:hypothetical protein [Pirellulaceae bacterium]
MNQSANVTSIDGVRELRMSLLKFEEVSRDGLTMLILEVRRAMEWLEGDRRRYWPEQVRRASQKVVEARNELERCELKYGSEEAPSCYEQKMALQRAKRRLRFCEDQVKVVKQWIRAVRQELNDFEGQAAKLTSILDSDIPHAVTTLERMLRALDKYAGGNLVDGVDVGARGVSSSPGASQPEPAQSDQGDDDADDHGRSSDAASALEDPKDE